MQSILCVLLHSGSTIDVSLLHPYVRSVYICFIYGDSVRKNAICNDKNENVVMKDYGLGADSA